MCSTVPVPLGGASGVLRPGGYLAESSLYRWAWQSMMSRPVFVADEAASARTVLRPLPRRPAAPAARATCPPTARRKERRSDPMESPGPSSPCEDKDCGSSYIASLLWKTHPGSRAASLWGRPKSIAVVSRDALAERSAAASRLTELVFKRALCQDWGHCFLFSVYKNAEPRKPQRPGPLPVS